MPPVLDDAPPPVLDEPPHEQPHEPMARKPGRKDMKHYSPSMFSTDEVIPRISTSRAVSTACIIYKFFDNPRSREQAEKCRGGGIHWPEGAFFPSRAPLAPAATEQRILTELPWTPATRTSPRSARSSVSTPRASSTEPAHSVKGLFRKIPPPTHCHHCAARNAAAGSKRLFRVLMSVATDQKVFTAICFDRTARVIFGCSADEFFDFAKLHPFARKTSFSSILVVHIHIRLIALIYF
ncbi:hypothetical protein CRG98_028171 [Punica granatum]|uniref:Uncharacterized protein n=1 Tax=Punica granatum TaxID=22663 RepID=A0A2I0J6A9_PUNGR|nr:hypothetical protein CRG98_028171 [Punica granatum]